MKKHGFTLIEILIAVAIIAILTAIGIVSYNSVNKRARDAKRLGDMEQLRSSLEMYRSDFGYYPAVNPGSFDVASNLSTILTVDNTYLPTIPTDPQSPHLYYYESTGQDPITGKYYGYCLCARLETQAVLSSSCTDTLPGTPQDTCNYGVRQP